MVTADTIQGKRANAVTAIAGDAEVSARVVGPYDGLKSAVEKQAWVVASSAKRGLVDASIGNKIVKGYPVEWVVEGRKSMGTAAPLLNMGRVAGSATFNIVVDGGVVAFAWSQRGERWGIGSWFGGSLDVFFGTGAWW